MDTEISDVDICKAVAIYQNGGKEYPYESLAREFNCSIREAFTRCEKAAADGLIDYGVSLRTAWLTKKGEQLLQKAQMTLQKFIMAQLEKEIKEDTEVIKKNPEYISYIPLPDITVYELSIIVGMLALRTKFSKPLNQHPGWELVKRHFVCEGD